MKFLSAVDKFFFGSPGEVSGLLGTPLNYVLDNPGKTAVAISVTVATAEPGAGASLGAIKATS